MIAFIALGWTVISLLSLAINQSASLPFDPVSQFKGSGSFGISSLGNACGSISGWTQACFDDVECSRPISTDHSATRVVVRRRKTLAKMKINTIKIGTRMTCRGKTLTPLMTMNRPVARLIFDKKKNENQKKRKQNEPKTILQMKTMRNI